MNATYRYGLLLLGVGLLSLFVFRLNEGFALNVNPMNNFNNDLQKAIVSYQPKNDVPQVTQVNADMQGAYPVRNDVVPQVNVSQTYSLPDYKNVVIIQLSN